MSFHRTLITVATLALSAGLVACNNDQLPTGGGNVAGPVGDTVAITSMNRVISFGRAPSANLTSNRAITGLMAGESLLGIDVRPNDGMIYTVTNQARIYTLDPATGALTMKGTLSAGAATAATCAGGPPAAYTGLMGTEFAFDFNPVADRLRLVSDTAQDLRINVDTGAVTVDCPITFASGSGTPHTTSAGYTNSVPNATTTALFYIDTNNDMLYAIDNTGGQGANGGVITPVGPLGVNATDINGFDIQGADMGYAVFTVGGTPGFYRINMTTGAATVLATFSLNDPLRGLALRQ